MRAPVLSTFTVLSYRIALIQRQIKHLAHCLCPSTPAVILGKIEYPLQHAGVSIS